MDGLANPKQSFAFGQHRLSTLCNPCHRTGRCCQRRFGEEASERRHPTTDLPTLSARFHRAFGQKVTADDIACERELGRSPG